MVDPASLAVGTLKAVHALQAGGGVLKGMAKAIQELYRMGADVNDYINRHIDELKVSDNQMIASTGRVLEATKFGFGLGYISSMTIIATGQLLLGNNLVSVGAGVIFSPTNPVAMTCAAVGAIYYGWGALSSDEQNHMLERLSAGFEMGIELVKAIINFVITKTKDLLSSKHLAEFKQYIQEQAALFGNSLYSVTHEMVDLVKGTADKAADLLGDAARETSGAAKRVVDGAKEKAKALRSPKAAPAALPDPFKDLEND